MKKRIARLEYRFLIHRDAAEKQYEQHIINIRFVGESKAMSYKFTTTDDAMRFLNKVSQTNADDHS